MSTASTIEDLKGNKRFSLGMPNVDNGNHLWIQMFQNAQQNRAKRALSWPAAPAARHSELEIRQLIREMAPWILSWPVIEFLLHG